MTLLVHYEQDLRATEQKTTAIADRAHAWMVLRDGDADTAAALVVRAAEKIRGHVALYAAPMLHDAVRFGRADLAVDALGDVAAQLDAPLPLAMRDHAHAAVTGGPAQLLAAAENLAALGARQLAAEALARADGPRHTARIAELVQNELVVVTVSASSVDALTKSALQTRRSHPMEIGQ
jgi:hypothetical protein